MSNEKHWTDAHIIQEGEYFVGFDEAGLEHCRYKDKEQVVASLIWYADNVLGKGKRHD